MREMLELGDGRAGARGRTWPQMQRELLRRLFAGLPRVPGEEVFRSLVTWRTGKLEGERMPRKVRGRQGHRGRTRLLLFDS